MNLAHAIHLLAEVGGQHAHRELLIRVVGIETAQAHEAFPADVHAAGIVRHISTDKVFLKCIVTSRHRSVRSEQGGSSNQFKRNIKVEIVPVDVDTQTFQTAEGSMAFVAVIDGRLHAHGFKQADTSHAEEHLLLDTHLAVAAIESTGNTTVFRRVLFDISIKQV